MMRYTPYLALVGFAVLAGVTLSTAAFAHPGNHSGMSADALMEHLATSPFHLVTLMAAVAAAGYGLWRLAGRFLTR